MVRGDNHPVEFGLRHEKIKRICDTTTKARFNHNNTKLSGTGKISNKVHTDEKKGKKRLML